MEVSDKLIKMLKHHEGVRYRPYRCPAKLWTIGVGHVLYPNQAKVPFAERDTIPLEDRDNREFSAEEVDNILKTDLNRFKRGVITFCGDDLTQGQFDALVSFSFNLGLGTLQRSTLRQKVLRKDFEGAAEEFLKYTKAGGKVLKGLVTRRNDEKALFLS